MSYSLFLDDLRNPPWWIGHDPIIARDNSELVLAIQLYGVPGAISFDHDLGKFDGGALKPNALQGMKWLIDYHLDGHIDLNQVGLVFIHSANPAGVENLVSMWDSFSAQCLTSGVKAVRRPIEQKNTRAAQNGGGNLLRAKARGR